MRRLFPSRCWRAELLRNPDCACRFALSSHKAASLSLDQSGVGGAADRGNSRRAVVLEFRSTHELDRAGDELSAAGRIVRTVLEDQLLGWKIESAVYVYRGAALEVVRGCDGRPSIAEEDDARCRAGRRRAQRDSGAVADRGVGERAAGRISHDDAVKSTALVRRGLPEIAGKRATRVPSGSSIAKSRPGLATRRA